MRRIVRKVKKDNFVNIKNIVIVWGKHVISYLSGYVCEWVFVRILRVLLSILFPPQIQHKFL